jgi:hypothetical protein
MDEKPAARIVRRLSSHSCHRLFLEMDESTRVCADNDRMLHWIGERMAIPVPLL